jgi:hypothetical protein
MVRKYKVYIDENLPPQLAEGLNKLQQPQNNKDGFEVEVLSIKQVFGQGAKDEDWIPELGKENGIVITQDFNIQQTKHQRQLYIDSGIGIFFLKTPSKSGFQYWDFVKKMVNEWETIKKIIKKENVPFAYRGSSNKPFEKMDF